MSITAKIHRGSVTLPPDLNIPDGTEVETVIPEAALANGTRASGGIGTGRQRAPELCATVLPGCSLRLPAQNLQCLAADERKLLAQFNQGLQLFLFRSLQKPFVVAVH